jgi:hypothetical protein
MGMPETITQSNLSMFGFASKNDRPFVKALSFIGFLDTGNKPTEAYKNFRLKEKSRFTMATSLRSSYSELFNLYPDANQQGTDPLQDFFKSKTDAGEAVVGMQVSTFKTLCDFADFGPLQEGGAGASEDGSSSTPLPANQKAPALPGQFVIEMPITINVALDAKDSEGIKALVELIKVVRSERISESSNGGT